MVEERDGDGNLLVRYVYGHDLISQTRPSAGSGSVTSYYHYDGLGSTRALSSTAGIVTDEYIYDAFGNLLDKSGVTENTHLYTGELFDSNISFYYLRARYMNPKVGRFITMDSFAGIIHDPYSLHKYLYAHVNPVNNIDPTGHMTTMQGVAIAGTMVGILAGIQSDSLLLTEPEPMSSVNPTEVSPTKLVTLAMAAMKHGYETTFIFRASQVTSGEPLKPQNGKDFLLLLSQNSSPAEQIRELFVFSHAYSRGILMQDDQGFYVDTGFWGKVNAFFGFTSSQDIHDLVKRIQEGDIAFSEDAVIKLFGCNLATGEFAQKLSNATGATVIASEGKVSPINKKDSRGKEFETGWFNSDDAWYEHTPNQTRRKLGKKIRAW